MESAAPTGTTNRRRLKERFQFALSTLTGGVASISIAGRRGKLEDLEQWFQKGYPDLRLKKNESPLVFRSYDSDKRALR